MIKYYKLMVIKQKPANTYFQVLVVVLQIAIASLYGFCVKYSYLADSHENSGDDDVSFSKLYPSFQDISVMIFIGFGFLMTFLKTYSWSAVGFNLALSTVVFQLYILFRGFWFRVVGTYLWDEKIFIDLGTLSQALFCCGAVLISFGGVLGKLNLFQLVVMGVIEAFIYALNEAVTFEKLHVVDVGGSITIHVFGAYFGLMVAWVISPKETRDHPQNGANYNSNLFAMIGTLFLWVYWPSFNSFFAINESEKLRCVINTLLSLTGSTICVFVFSSIFKRGKLSMEDILNATLAGGVIMGSNADQILNPYASVLLGYFAGALSTFGFEVLSAFLQRSVGLFDTCGIHNLHGLPGLFGGLFSALFIGIMTDSSLGYSVESRFGRSASEQASLQLVSLLVTLGFAIITGVLTGCLLKLSIFDGPEELFEDDLNWVMDESTGPARGNVVRDNRESLKTLGSGSGLSEPLKG